MLVFLSSCGIQGYSSGLIVPVDVLALVEAPQRVEGGRVVHAQWVFEELEGMPPNSYKLQFTRTIWDVWFEHAAPWRFRVIDTIEPGGLTYDGGWNGEQVWRYNPFDYPLYAVVYAPDENEVPSGPYDLTRYVHSYSDLLEQAQESPDHLRDLGTEEIQPWGSVQVIAYDWDGATAITELYYGYDHTILFKIAEANHWLVEWVDIVHAEDGDIVHRRHQLSVWEELDTSEADIDTWDFVLPEQVTAVEAYPEPTPTVTLVDEQELPTLTIAGWTVPDFGFTPFIPAYVPENLKLTSVKVLHMRGAGNYKLTYELNGNPILNIFQVVGVGYAWGNTPEIIELSWAKVALGANDPLAPPGWIAHVEPYPVEGKQLPNLILSLSLPERELMLEIIESLQPVEQP